MGRGCVGYIPVRFGGRGVPDVRIDPRFLVPQEKVARTNECVSLGFRKAGDILVQKADEILPKAVIQADRMVQGSQAGGFGGLWVIYGHRGRSGGLPVQFPGFVFGEFFHPLLVGLTDITDTYGQGGKGISSVG